MNKIVDMVCWLLLSGVGGVWIIYFLTGFSSWLVEYDTTVRIAESNGALINGMASIIPMLVFVTMMGLGMTAIGVGVLRAIEAITNEDTNAKEHDETSPGRA